MYWRCSSCVASPPNSQGQKGFAGFLGLDIAGFSGRPGPVRADVLCSDAGGAAIDEADVAKDNAEDKGAAAAAFIGDFFIEMEDILTFLFFADTEEPQPPDMAYTVSRSA